MNEPIKVTSEPKVTMSAVKLDRAGNVVEEISFENVEAHVTSGLLEQIREAAREGWQEGKRSGGED